MRRVRYDGWELLFAFVFGVLLTVVTWLLIDQVRYHNNCDGKAVTGLFDNARYCVPDDVLNEYKD